MMLTKLFGRTSVMRWMRNQNNDDFDDAVNCWDLPVFARVCDFRKVVYFAPVCIPKVIYICICYFILSIIMYDGRAVVAMPDQRIRSIFHGAVLKEGITGTVGYR
jgi:hypothetical protein